VAAALGFALRNSAPRVCAWLGLGSLALSLVSAATLLAQGGASFSTGWIGLPESFAFPAADGSFSGQTEVLGIPLAFSTGAFQLLFAVTTAAIAAGVTLFALRERRDDPRSGQFFATLTLFAGAMLLFLTTDTLLVTYFAWELMGICSYLLIAHPGTEAARRAARRAFWTTRATDFGLLFAVIILLAVFGCATLSDIQPAAWYETSLSQGQDTTVLAAWLTATALLLLGAVIGKAAQLPLSFWLPGAMVAPSPVSALLHAATMVAAGPYLLIRLRQLFFVGDGALVEGSQPALLAATLVGAATLLLGGVMALCAAEPKRILAFSTVSHLGLVVLAAGVMAPGAGYFHLLAHAWFKAALFLAVGYIVYTALARPGSGEAKLAELRGAAANPLARWTLIVAGLALAGFAGSGGFFGKEQVLTALVSQARTTFTLGEQFPLGQQFPLAAAGWNVAAVLAFLSLPVTAAYITRLVGVLAWGRPAEAPAGQQNTETAAAAAPASRTGWGPGLTAALVFAAVGCIGLPLGLNWFGAQFADAGYGMGWDAGGFGWPALLGVVLTLGGIALGWFYNVHRPALGARLVAGDSMLAGFIRFFDRGMYLEEFWDAVCGRFGLFGAVIAEIIDKGLIDWLAERGGRLGRGLAAAAAWFDHHVVDGLRYWSCEIWWLLKRIHARTMQTGRIQHYMLIVLIAALVLCVVVLKPMGQRLAMIVENLLGRGVL
jgi:NADH-quinone oxidoreductase subunit L